MGASARMEGPRSSCATEMDLFLVSAANICAARGLGGRRLCCSNKGIVLLLWMDKKRQTFGVLLHLSFASNDSCRAYIDPTWQPSRTTTGRYMSMAKIDIVCLVIVAVFVGKCWANCNWNVWYFEWNRPTEEIRNDMRYRVLNSGISGHSRSYMIWNNSNLMGGGDGRFILTIWQIDEWVGSNKKVTIVCWCKIRYKLRDIYKTKGLWSAFPLSMYYYWFVCISALQRKQKIGRLLRCHAQPPTSIVAFTA